MQRLFIIVASILFIVLTTSADGVQVFKESKRDRSQRLKDITPKKKGTINVVVPNTSATPFEQTDRPVMEELDTLAQTWPGALSIPATIKNFEGMSANGHIPPDTCGEAGLNHYVQMVNRQLAIFNKSGTVLYGPVNINTLWTGFGGLCEAQNQGDPIVVYDQLANRWVISQFAYSAPSVHLECIAVSATDDPTGAWYRYSYSLPAFNDYPKIGVWPDGYYATYILRNPDWSPIGGRICAYDRSKMLIGGPASAQCFDLGLANRRLLPADLDGITPPPQGAPHFSMNVSATSLNLWKLKVNWTNPASTKLTGPVSIPVAAYTPACNSQSQNACIPQPGVSQTLHAFSDRLMFRLSYRNFGSHQSLVSNHSVQTGTGISAVRWYEVRNPDSAPVLFQQGTYSPDTNHRWMGSAASDLNGNIAVGYSVSSKTVSPGIRYTGRLVTDPKGTLPQGEAIIMNGTGSQTVYNRWGDYSALTVDPADDCTFWYTNEYIKTTGSLNWQTRIASFKFSSCGCAVPAGITNNTAAPAGQTGQAGVNVTWARDPGNWGDNATGERSYDVLRDGIVIASTLPFGTTTFTDNSAVTGQNYTYSVRYTNGCSKNATTAGVRTGDFLCNVSSQLIKNPGFESGRTLWNSNNSANINNSNGTFRPFQGSWKVTLNGLGTANTKWVWQQLTIPSNACSATLSLWLRVVTGETVTSARDNLSIEILSSSGQLLKTLAKYSNLNASGSYSQKTFNLAPYIGQTIRIRFQGVENSSRKTTFLIDETALNVVTP